MKKKINVPGVIIILLILACLVIQPVFAAGSGDPVNGVQGNSAPGTDPGTQQSRAPLRASASPVAAVAINPLVTEVGKISLSMDAQGTSASDGTLVIVKPEGATVKKAYLAAATRGFSQYKLGAGDIKLDGTAISWDIAHLPSSIKSYNYLSDVTSTVKTKIDAAAAGEVTFSVTESGSSLIDGEILAVIFNDPAQTTDNTIVLLFGAQKTTGDDFDIGLATPINKADPNLAIDFALGISYGYQQPNKEKPNQYSIIDVSTNTKPLQRLTTWAGGDDDGAPANGALITVGGTGDSTANPADPYAMPVGDDHYDDELYSILPFVADKDTTITVHTLNPSNDDNIFFAALNLHSAIAVVDQGIVLSPASATNDVGETHTLTGKIQDDKGIPVVGKEVTFEIIAGPNIGKTGSDISDANGEVTFAYVGYAEGKDTIVARFTDDAGKLITSNEVTKTWKIGPVPTPEFPTIAVPIGIILGVVYFIITRYPKKE